MRVIYNAKVPSLTGQRDKRTGQIKTYLVVIYDTGEASCTCAGFLFQGKGSEPLPPSEKHRYRCKHLLAAFREQGIDDQGWATVAPPGAPKEPPSPPPPPPSRPKASLWLDDDEDAPRIRR